MHLLTALLALATPDAAIAPGSYGLVMRFVTEADAPIVGRVTTTTTTTALVDISTVDGRVIARQRACSMATDGGLFSVRAGPAFVKAMAPATYELVIEGDRVRADLGIASMGVDPKARRLPTNESAFTDPDQDGRRGVPLEIDVAGMKLRLDVASIGHAVLEGRVRGGRVDGKPRILFSEERILDGLPAFASGGTKTVVEAKSSFSFEPLAKDATCGVVERLGRGPTLATAR